MRKPFDGNYPITQTFGNKLILNGIDYYGSKYGYLGHNGIDYGLPTGINVLAPHKGVIKEAYFDLAGYGWYVKIENDIEGSILAHMLSLVVKVGDVVSEGQLIGISDNTGSSTGSHLHWGYYRFPRDKSNGYNGFIDQTSYIVLIPTPTQPSQPSGDSNTIKDFLISKGYTHSETHLDVIKAMYESDLKLKTGQYITKEDCNKEKESLQQISQKDFDEKLNKEKADWETQKKVDIAEAVKNAKIEVQGQYQDYIKVKDSGEYKFALFLFKLLHLKGGEK